VNFNFVDFIRNCAGILTIYRSKALNFYFKKIFEYSEIVGKNLVIIAPHPDDETFACGGVIAQKVRESCQVSVIFMTRGEASHDGCCNISRLEIGKFRQAITTKATHVLGLSNENLHWLDLEDCHVPSGNASQFISTVKRLTELLKSINPDAVLYPHKLDLHQDHINTCYIAVRAADELNIRRRYSYPTWLRMRLQPRHLLQPIRSKTIKVDINHVLQQKMKAISIYLDDVPKGCPNQIPTAGKLEEKFINLFRSNYEIFFDESKPLDRCLTNTPYTSKT
jgi:N-acetylglucosamine malate deacetylase 1